MTTNAHSERKQNLLPGVIITVFLAVMVLVYCAILVFFASHLWKESPVTGKILAIGVSIVPLFGIWILYKVFSQGLQLQRMSREAKELGKELDTSTLRRRPSGRFIREDADALFFQVKKEWESDPHSWINNYRLARAYDYAGDRTRARHIMKTAQELYSRHKNVSSSS